MLRGRFFNKADTAASLPVIVVNREFVREYEGEDSDPGKFLGTPLMGFKDKRQAVVVGVLDDERQDRVVGPSRPEIEVCMSQITPGSTFYGPTSIAMSIAVRTERDPATVIPELRDVMRKASPELANSSFTTMEQVVEDTYGSQQLASRLVEIFGGTALVLCIAGVYGLLAYLVTQRTRELGIRIALGAQRVRFDGDGAATGGWDAHGRSCSRTATCVCHEPCGRHAALRSEAARSVDDGGSDADSVNGRPGGRVHPGTSCGRR
jgi:ABC-type antimicrobial peptide transport system permease subunit